LVKSDGREGTEGIANHLNGEEVTAWAGHYWQESTVVGNLFERWVRRGGFGICELMGLMESGGVWSWVNMLGIFFSQIGRMLQLFGAEG
jgi:hypothetical protein